MKKPVLFLLFLLVVCLPASGQEEPSFPRQGTTITAEVDGLTVTVVSIEWEKWYYDRKREYPGWDEYAEETGQRVRVDDADSIKAMLPAGCRLVTRKVKRTRDEIETVESFTAAGGLKLIFHEWSGYVPRYYPEAEVLEIIPPPAECPGMLFDVRTGEDAHFPENILASPDGRLRVVHTSDVWGWASFFRMEVLDSRTGEYRNMGDVNLLFGENRGFEYFYSSFENLFWVGNRLYAHFSDYYFEVVFPDDLSPWSEKEPPAARKSAVRKAVPLWEMEVRDPLEIDYGMFDRVVRSNGHAFRVRRIPASDFQHLYAYYKDRQTVPSVGVSGSLDDIARVLPGYRLVTTLGNYPSIAEIRREGHWRLFPDIEQEEYYGYYPDEHLLMYSGGHGSDQAIDLYTGEKENRNPGITIYTADRKYRLTGLHDGQDSFHYRFDRLNSQTGKYETTTSLWDLAEALPQEVMGRHVSWAYDFFWIGHTCYFRVEGYGYCSVTMNPE